MQHFRCVDVTALPAKQHGDGIRRSRSLVVAIPLRGAQRSNVGRRNVLLGVQRPREG